MLKQIGGALRSGDALGMIHRKNLSSLESSLVIPPSGHWSQYVYGECYYKCTADVNRYE